MRIPLLALLSAAATISSIGASAPPATAATAIVPVDGATVASEHPTFSWALSGDEVDAIHVSRQARTTAEGQFYDEDRVTSDSFGSPITSWAPTSAIAEGTYWWNLSWHLPDYSASGYTTPLRFTIPPKVRSVLIRQKRYESLRNIEFHVQWWSNTEAVTVKAAIYRKRKRLWRQREAVSSASIAVLNRESFDLYFGSGGLKRVTRPGERLRFVATVSGGGRVASKAGMFRVPRANV
jgi:hypothetical protein